MNKVILVGNLTKDPELRFTQKATAVTNFTLAIHRKNRNANGEHDTDFIQIVVWGQTAEYCAKNLHKGGKCAVFGMLQTRNYEGRDGQRRTVTEVVADEVENLERRQSQGSAGAFDSVDNEQGAFAQQMHQISDEDLPF